MAFDLRKLVIAALGWPCCNLAGRLLDRLFPASAAVTPDTSFVGGTNWTTSSGDEAGHRRSAPCP